MFSRSVLRWLQTIDLSQSYSNPYADFASGYLVAEIVAHYIPSVSTNSFSNFLSIKMRTDNWNQLMKIFIAHRIPITQTMIDDVIKKREGAAVKLIEVLYTTFTKRTPCHPEIGTISNKPTEPTKSDVSILPPPDLPKPQEEPIVETPQVIPKRQKFIGASTTQRNGTATDLTPISFESASVVKSGPGFLQLRNQNATTTQSTSDKQLENAVEEVKKHSTAETLQNFVKCIEDPCHIQQFIGNYPPNVVIQLMKQAAPYISQEQAPFFVDVIGEIFIPTAELSTVSIDDLVDFIFAQPSNDPFTHHFLLDKLLEVTDKTEIAKALYSFVERETKFSTALCQYCYHKVTENQSNDPSYVLPLVIDKLLEYDKQNAIQMIPLFVPTNDPKKDIILSNLYIHAAPDCLKEIKDILGRGDRSIAAHILDEICTSHSISNNDLISLLLVLPDSNVVLNSEYSVVVNNETVAISPIIKKLNSYELVRVICQNIIDTSPEELSQNEISLLNVLMKNVGNVSTDANNGTLTEWVQVFQTLNEFLYLAFCDENCCKQATDVCLTFFKLLQNEVLGTFSNLFKALNFVFPTNCPVFCKSASIEFLQNAAEISPSFSQSILKLLMNFPPKTYSDLDKLVVHLKKVKK